MIEDLIIPYINEFGIAAIAGILLWDKIKTNGALKKVVENNNLLLKEIKSIIKRNI